MHTVITVFATKIILKHLDNSTKLAEVPYEDTQHFGGVLKLKML